MCTKLIHDDCLAAMKTLEDNSVDLILTDPPYNLGLFMKNRDTNLKKMRDNFLEMPDGTIWNMMSGLSP